MMPSGSPFEAAIFPWGTSLVCLLNCDSPGPNWRLAALATKPNVEVSLRLEPQECMCSPR